MLSRNSNVSVDVLWILMNIVS